MTFFKRKVSNESSTVVNVDEVYVVTTIITSSYDDGSGCGPRCVTWYFLAKLENEEYYELFSGKKLEKKEDLHKDGMVSINFDTPYIENVKPLKEYLRNESTKKMDIKLLFDFITDMNVLGSLGAFKESEDVED
jgi:hypothetical protein